MPKAWISETKMQEAQRKAALVEYYVEYKSNSNRKSPKHVLSIFTPSSLLP